MHQQCWQQADKETERQAANETSSVEHHTLHNLYISTCYIIIQSTCFIHSTCYIIMQA